MHTNKNGIKIYEAADYEGMRKAGKVAAECLDYITDYVKVGISTGELDDLCNDFMKSKGAVSACLGYHGYPKATCISINQVICHGIPDYERKLADGDILNIDVTAIVDGYFGDIGAVIEEYAHKYGYSVVDMFCGHGVGKVFHDAPNVMHCGRKGTGPVMEEGMFFTIEPMINLGKKDGVILSNGWTAVTCDHAWSAQFEHSLGVTKDGCEVFTYSPKGFTKPPYE